MAQVNFPKDIIITDINTIYKLSSKANAKSKMDNRPWYGIAFALDGEVVYIHNSKKIKLSENRVVFIPKNSCYEVLYTKTGSFAVINFLTNKDLPIDEFITIKTSMKNELINEFSLMYNSVLNGHPLACYSNLSSLYKILSELTRDYSKKDIPPVLQKAIEYIENNIDSPTLSNTRIAAHLSISEVYLRKLFNQNLSVSVNRYIQNKRIERAKKLLFDATTLVTEVSEKCGYSNVYYFCNAFKRTTGYTPTQYRYKKHFEMF